MSCSSYHRSSIIFRYNVAILGRLRERENHHFRGTSTQGFETRRKTFWIQDTAEHVLSHLKESLVLRDTRDPCVCTMELKISSLNEKSLFVLAGKPSRHWRKFSRLRPASSCFWDQLHLRHFCQIVLRKSCSEGGTRDWKTSQC